MSTISMSDEETEKLLAYNKSNIEDKLFPSATRQRAIIFTVLCLQFSSLCGNAGLLPLFPVLAGENGLTANYIAVVLSSYELIQCLFSPLFGSLVSTS